MARFLMVEERHGNRIACQKEAEVSDVRPGTRTCLRSRRRGGGLRRITHQRFTERRSTESLRRKLFRKSSEFRCCFDFGL
jgi:hypothetical protein